MQCLLLPQITEVHVPLTCPVDHYVPGTVLSAFLMMSLFTPDHDLDYAPAMRSLLRLITKGPLSLSVSCSSQTLHSSLYTAPGLSVPNGKNEVVLYGPFQLQHLCLGEFY